MSIILIREYYTKIMDGPNIREEKIKDIVSDTLDIAKEKISYKSHFWDDLNADSLDKAELILDLETEFGIKIPDVVAEQIVYFEDLVHKVNELIDNQ